ncbi:MAG: sigma-70 family RNA polymerase sigma factor [Acidobacteriaceae bacterium]|nr:sigma-70 family RNA polymerase sigma factor [Acidobacteriaceae bacterium]
MKDDLTKIDDEALIHLTIKGCPECFSVLFERHSTAMSRCVSTMVKHAADVEDILQNVFLKAWLKLSSFRFEATFRSWLTRIAINEVFQHYRHLRYRPSCAEFSNFEKLVCARDSPENLAERAECAQMLHLAIARLPKKYREIVLLCDIEQLTAGEAARHLNTTVPSVKTRRFRARGMLSAALTPIPVGRAVTRKAA